MDPVTTDNLRALEESLWRAETRFDDTLMDQTFAAGFFEFGRSGRIYARAEMLLGNHMGQEINAVLPLANFSARLLSADIAHVTYFSEVRYGETIERANRSSIWGLIAGRWQLHFHQGTAIQG